MEGAVRGPGFGRAAQLKLGWTVAARRFIKQASGPCWAGPGAARHSVSLPGDLIAVVSASGEPQ